MAIARLRKLLIALLVAAQPMSAAFAAAMPPLIAPCPVHAALLPADAQQNAGHAAHDMTGHASGGHQSHTMHGAPADDPLPQSENVAADFSFVCCTAHVSAVLTASFPDLHEGWPFAAAFRSEQQLTSGDLSSVDPPPRILL
jgi:hypothetical protein